MRVFLVERAPESVDRDKLRAMLACREDPVLHQLSLSGSITTVKELEAVIRFKGVNRSDDVIVVSTEYLPYDISLQYDTVRMGTELPLIIIDDPEASRLKPDSLRIRH